MTRDEKIYFSLLRIGLGTESPREILPELAKLQWGEIYRLAVRQGTGALIWDALRQLHAMEYLPLSLRVQWAYNVEQIEDRYRKQEKVLAGLSKFYASHSISLMLLKGYGLSFCYPCPEHRECGDIDIWLFGRQREADELLCREWGIRIDEDKHHHTVFLIDGIMVENHYDFLNVHAHASNREIEQLLRTYAEIHGETICLKDTEIHLPSPSFNALFLLRHAAAHFAAAEIGMRHIADWGMFILRYCDKIDWTELYATARRMNMHRFLNCINAISANSQKQTGTDIRSEDAGPAALSSGQGIGLMRPRHSACENAPHVHRLFRKRGYRGGIRIRVRRDYRRGFGRRRAISVSAA